MPLNKEGVGEVHIKVGDMAPTPGREVPTTPRVMEPHRAQLSRAFNQPPPVEKKPDQEMDALLGDLEAEAADAEGSAATTESDIRKIMAKYGGQSEELAKALLNQQRLTSQKDTQIHLLTQKPGATPAPPPTPVQMPAPVMPQVALKPWDSKKIGAKFLDDIPASLEELHEHTVGTLNTRVTPIEQAVTALQITFALDREFPGLITKDSMPIIDALASTAPGNSVMEKYSNAAKQYQTQFGFPLSRETPAPVPTDTQAAAMATPGATGRSTGKRMYYRDEIQRALRLLQPGSDEYRRVLLAADRAYKEGRVKDSRTA